MLYKLHHLCTDIIFKPFIIKYTNVHYVADMLRMKLITRPIFNIGANFFLKIMSHNLCFRQKQT